MINSFPIIMQIAQEPRRGICRILSQCSDRQLIKQAARYFMQKSHEMKQFQNKLDTSIRHLKTLENDESEDQHATSNVEIAETFYAQQSQPRLKLNKLLMDSPDKHNKNKLRSLPSEQLKSYNASTFRSPKSPKQKYNYRSQQRINLPNLLSKAKKGKLPTNASKNRQIEYERTKNEKTEEDLTYEQIKLERRKMEQTRHLIVLGKVYDENYRKDLRTLWTLKRNTKRNKYADF